MQPIEDLSTLSPLEFEHRRAIIIRDHIMSLPEDQRKKAYAFQCQLDLKRETMSNNEFMIYCFKEAGHNMDSIGSKMEVIQAKLGMNKPSLPNYADERKAQI